MPIMTVRVKFRTLLETILKVGLLKTMIWD